MSADFVLGFLSGAFATAVCILAADLIGTWLLERWVLHLSPARRQRDEEEGES